MNVTLIHKTTYKSTVCCMAEASRRVGIGYRQFIRWYNESKLNGTYFKGYVNYNIHFNTTILKQNREGYKNLPCHTDSLIV